MKKILTALATAAALVTSTGALAQGAYVGGALGATQFGGACDGFNGDCEESDSGFKLYGGYKFNPFVAIEASYTNFGTASANGAGTSVDIDATAIGVNVAGFVDFSPRVTGVARLGLSSNKADVSVRSGGYRYSDNDSSVQPYFGLGLGFRVMKNLVIEAAVDFTQLEWQDTDTDMRMFSAGVRYEF